jgi:hypothetical protein
MSQQGYRWRAIDKAISVSLAYVIKTAIKYYRIT